MKLIQMKQRYLPEVLRIEKLSFDLPWSSESLHSEIINSSSHFFISTGKKENEYSDIVTGYVILNTVADEGYIINLAVHPTFRRQGIAKELVEFIIKKAKKLKLAFVSLEVRESNEAAINLYNSFKFEKVGLRTEYYSKPKENAVLMTLNLKG